MSAVISLTNKKKISMSVPNGEGGMIEIPAGGTKMIRGDFDRYHKMMKSMNGLVVKLVEGKQRLVEAKKMIEGPRLVCVTNHKKIPIRLATGIGAKAVDIGPGETSDPFLGRVSTIKKFSAISVRYVEEKPKDEKPEDEKPADDEPSVPITTTEGEGGLENGATAEAEAIAKQAAADKVKAEKEAELNDPLAKRRRDLTLPATREEWDIHKEQLTFHDVRGLCKELGIKTKSLGKDDLIEAVTKELYPE